MAVPLWLHLGTSELDNVPYIKTPRPGHLLVSRIPYPPTRTTGLLLFALGRRVAGGLQENFPQNLPFRAARGCLRLPYPPTRTK
jgi:hypothetical protein